MLESKQGEDIPPINSGTAQNNEQVADQTLIIEKLQVGGFVFCITSYTDCIRRRLKMNS